MDLAKYRNLFLEEATEHLAEISRALLELEKDPSRGEALDLVFRMAHSIKGMAGSLDYASITELSHALEDRMDAYRSAGRVDPTRGPSAALPRARGPRAHGRRGARGGRGAARRRGPPRAPARRARRPGRPRAEGIAGSGSGNVPKKAPRRP